MAKLKSLKIKDKAFAFRAFGNKEEKKPAMVIFSRFPTPHETFTSIDKKDIFEGVDFSSMGKREIQSKIADKIIESFMRNMQAGNADYRRFMDECVDSFRDFEFGDSKIITASDFWQILPPDAAYVIAQEAFEYANERDEFTMGNLSA